jgi:two-component system response regulator YesN
MAYKMIIVDDERIIREGLLSIIDWNSLGFEIVNIFTDGREAIEYISSETVDVILTDIKMTFVSGIEVAKYVHEQRFDTKVILLSGHKEFELAVDAMKYGVQEYILKPTDIDKLSQIFTTLKQKLDEEKKDKEKIDIEKERFEETLPIIREQFFIDLLMGIIIDESYICERMRLIYPNINPNNCICFTADIQIKEYDNYIKDVWHYGENELLNSINNVLLAWNGKIQYHIIFKAHDTIQVFGLQTEGKSLENLETENVLSRKDIAQNYYIADIEQSLKGIRNELVQLFSLDITYNIRRVFESLTSIVENSNFILPENIKNNPGEKNNLGGKNNLGEKNILSKINKNEDMNRLKEQQKLLLSNISTGNMSAVKNIFHSFLYELKYLDIRLIKNYVVEMVAMVGDKLKETGIDPYDVTNGKFNYSLISSMKNTNEIEEWGESVFGSLAEYVLQSDKNQESNLITRAKRYIEENFTKDLSLEEVADYLYLSPFYFSRIFKKQTGESFIDYVIKVKIEHAKKLLGDQKYKAYEISEMVGYKSIRYFSKVFKMHTGHTPSEYRNIMSNELEQ